MDLARAIFRASFSLLLCFSSAGVVFGFDLVRDVAASEPALVGTWVGRIPCTGASIVKSRSIIFRTDGDNAWLTGYGKSGETYQSSLKNGKAKFTGVYKGVHKGEPFHKYIRATVRRLEDGTVKVSGSRGSRSNCHGVLKKYDTVVEDTRTVAARDKQKLLKQYENLPGVWKGKAGGLVKTQEDVDASFSKEGDEIIGQISFDSCFPEIRLVAVIEDETILISGQQENGSFSSKITPSFGEIAETSLYIPYKIVSSLSGCSKSETGFLRLNKL